MDILRLGRFGARRVPLPGQNPSERLGTDDSERVKRRLASARLAPTILQPRDIMRVFVADAVELKSWKSWKSCRGWPPDASI